MSSCGVVHGNAGRVMHDNSHEIMHASLGGAVVHKNSCNSHGADLDRPRVTILQA